MKAIKYSGLVIFLVGFGIFTSAVFNDINNDNIPDVFIGGRNAQLYAIDGFNGNIKSNGFVQKYYEQFKEQLLQNKLLEEMDILDKKHKMVKNWEI